MTERDHWQWQATSPHVRGEQHIRYRPRLLALATQDLGVDLVGAGVEQVHCPILQCPQVAIQGEVFIALADSLARN